MTRPPHYEWWIDSIQDSLAQIAQQHDAINVGSNACRHVCDETYIDLAHFVETVTAYGFCDVPRDVWRRIVELAAADDLESVASRSLAAQCLASDYLRRRQRWVYGRDAQP